MTEVSGSSDSGIGEGGRFTESVAARRIGRRLGARWTLDKVLGVGGSACVYAAHHANGRRAAVKVLHADCAVRPRQRRRFLSEGYAANRVGHPGAVSVFDDGVEPDGTMFLVMELLSGKSLLQWLETGGARSELEVAHTAIGILDVLAAAHDRGILHRDIKPSNVFRTNEGDIKVLDFGSARIHGVPNYATVSGAVLGTPAFMAPELAAGRLEELDARTDIWSLGATMFQLLTGATVHAARTSQEALVKAATERAPSLSAVRPGTSPELATIVDRALAFTAADRWPNARAMRGALADAFGLPRAQTSDTLVTVDSDNGESSASKRRPHTAILLFASALGILVLVGALAQRRSTAEERPLSAKPPGVVRDLPATVTAPAMTAGDIAPPVASTATLRSAPFAPMNRVVREHRVLAPPRVAHVATPATSSSATTSPTATSQEELLDQWR